MASSSRPCTALALMPPHELIPAHLMLVLSIPKTLTIGDRIPRITAHVYSTPPSGGRWRCSWRMYIIFDGTRYETTAEDPHTITVHHPTHPQTVTRTITIDFRRRRIIRLGKFVIRIRAWQAPGSQGYTETVPHAEGWTSEFEVVPKSAPVIAPRPAGNAPNSTGNAPNPTNNVPMRS